MGNNEKDLTLNNLLNHITIIQKKYNDLAEYSGENYNIFDILGLRSNELSHSTILSNLLNAKGKHGQKDLFLKLFIEQIKNDFDCPEKTKILTDFKTNLSKSSTEKYIGSVNFDNDEGGRIDIVIEDEINSLFIENKIYAGDQSKQLIRYNKFNKKAPLLYLTLFGEDPSEDSIISTLDNSLILGSDFINISYHTHIKLWIEQCIQAMYNKPFIRETLSQYLILIKSLTNQSNNSMKGTEVVNTILNSKSNFEAYIDAVDSMKTTRDAIFENNIFPIIKKIAVDLNLDLILDEQGILDTKNSWLSFKFMNNKLNQLNLKLVFAANQKFGGMNKVIFGLSFLNKTEVYSSQSIKRGFDNAFNVVSKSNNIWLCYTEFNEFENWEDLKTLKNIRYGDNFERTILNKVATIIKLIEMEISDVDFM